MISTIISLVNNSDYYDHHLFNLFYDNNKVQNEIELYFISIEFLIMYGDTTRDVTIKSNLFFIKEKFHWSLQVL